MIENPSENTKSHDRFLSGLPRDLVVVPHPHFPRNPTSHFPDSASQFRQTAVPAFEPPHAQVLQAQFQHGQDPQLRVQVQPRRLVRPLSALQESQPAIFHGLFGNYFKGN